MKTMQRVRFVGIWAVVLGVLGVGAQRAEAQRASFSDVGVEWLERPTVPQDLVRNVQFNIHANPEFFNQDDMRRWGGNVALLKSDAERLQRMAFWTLDREMELVNSGGDLRVEVALGPGRQGNYAVKSGPVRSGSQELTYFAEVAYNLPVRVQLVRSNGEVLDAFELPVDVKVMYGNEPISTLDKTATGVSYMMSKLDFRSEADLRKYIAEPDGQRFIRRKAVLVQMSRLIDELEPRLFFSRDKPKVAIATAKNKNFDYTALDAAQEQALAAFKLGNVAGLTQVMEVWTQWLGKADLLNPKSEVNTDVARGLHLNLAVAHIYRGEFSEAAAHVSKARSMTGPNDAEWPAVEDMTNLLARRRKAALHNGDLTVSEATPTFKAPDLKDVLGRRVENRELELFDGRDRYEELGVSIAAWRASLEGTSPESQASAPAERSVSQQLGSRLEPATGGYMLRFNPLVDGSRVGKPMPEEIFGVDKLVYFDYSRMGLTEVPAALGSLTSLKTLVLDGNALTTFPAAVCQVHSLQKLHLKGNAIATIPAGISGCKSLEMIDMRGNPVTPEGRAALAALVGPECKVKWE